MDSKQELPWQQSAGALVFLLLSLMVVVIYGVAKAWPFAISGNQVAVGILLEAFGFVAVFLAGLAAGFKTPRLITWGAPVWATVFYFSSLFLDDMVNGNTAGIAIRVGATASFAFVVALAYLNRNSVRQDKKAPA